MKRFKFEKKLSGMVLYVEDRIPVDMYCWKRDWRKATQMEADDFFLELTKLQIYKEIVDDLKKVHPELMI